MRERKKGWTDGALLLGIGVGRSGERLLCCRGYSGDDSEVLPAITPSCPVFQFQDAAGLNYLMELRFFSRRTSITHSGVGLSIDGQLKSPTEGKA